MTIDEAIKHAEEVAESKEKQVKNGDWEKDSLTERNCIKCAEEHRQLVEWLRDYKRLKEQEPCEDTISRQNDILPNIDKEVESYKKLLKHPVVKHIIGLNEEQEQLDFVQPHKRIPVMLTVESDCISRQEAIDTIRQLYIDLAIQKYVIDILKALPSVKPQESCDVPDTNVGDIISKQTVLDTISELNAISFYEAQEDSKECYYELRQAIKDLSPVKQEPKTVIYSGDGYADGYMVYDMAECPNCSYEYEYGDKDWGLPFCPSCGQKLNWERSDKK